MRAFALFALAASPSLAACPEEERTIPLEPDGRGTLRLVRTLGKETTGTILRALPRPGR